MDHDFTGKVALVTGASGGIGLATAQKFAESGASVVLSARRTELIEQEAKRLTDAGYTAIAIPADVTDAGQVEALVAGTVERFGRLDFAVNNAGILAAGSATHELAQEDWDRQIAVNLTAVFVSMKHELAQMVKQGSGAIVNLSSVSGHRAFGGLAGYSASKHGVLGLTKSAGVEYAAQGIRVNAVAPGFVETPMTAPFASDPAGRQLMDEANPMKRTSQPEEIAETIAWLCSDASSFITAESIAADGGMTA